MSLIRRIRPEKTGVRAPLGDLEMAIMRHVWACGEDGCLSSDLVAALNQAPERLSVVSTTLDRLYDKGILRREREGKRYRYCATLSEAQLQQRIVEGVLGDLISQFPQAVATYFAQQGLADVAEKADETAKLAELAKRLEGMQQRSDSDSGANAGGSEAGDGPQGTENRDA